METAHEVIGVACLFALPFAFAFFVTRLQKRQDIGIGIMAFAVCWLGAFAR